MTLGPVSLLCRESAGNLVNLRDACRKSQHHRVGIAVELPSVGASGTCEFPVKRSRDFFGLLQGTALRRSGMSFRERASRLRPAKHFALLTPAQRNVDVPESLEGERRR